MYLRIQLTISQNWFRKWLGAGQATTHCLNQWWLIYWHSLNELMMLSQMMIVMYWSKNKLMYIESGDIIKWYISYSDWMRILTRVLNSQKTPHISPSRLTYGVCIMRIWKKINRVNMALHRFIQMFNVLFWMYAYLTRNFEICFLKSLIPHGSSPAQLTAHTSLQPLSNTPVTDSLFWASPTLS